MAFFRLAEDTAAATAHRGAPTTPAAARPKAAGALRFGQGGDMASARAPVAEAGIDESAFTRF
jgi:hypothetical protein